MFSTSFFTLNNAGNGSGNAASAVLYCSFIRTSSSPFSIFIFDCIVFSEASTESNCFFQAA